MDNAKWPALRGWLPGHPPQSGDAYPGIGDYIGPTADPVAGTVGGPAGGTFSGSVSGPVAGPVASPVTAPVTGSVYGSPAPYFPGFGGGKAGIPFNLAELKTFVDRMGGLDGILNTFGKMQRLFSTVQQMAPLVRLLLNRKNAAEKEDEEEEEMVDQPPRRRRRSGNRGGGRRRRPARRYRGGGRYGREHGSYGTRRRYKAAVRGYDGASRDRPRHGEGSGGPGGGRRTSGRVHARGARDGQGPPAPCPRCGR